MITVHHLENSRSQRILFLLEELGVAYEVKTYKRDKNTSLAPKALEAIHPLGKSPVITDGDVTVAESAAIVEYLVDKYDDGRLRPAADAPEYLDYRYWLHYAEGTLASLMILALFVGRIETAKMPFFARPIARKIAMSIRSGYLDHTIERNLSFVNMSIGEGRWFCGERLTAADIQMSFPLEAAEARLDLSPYPQITSWLRRVRELDSYQSAIEKGGPYALMGNNPD
jgi:glutathione S-transferase